MLDFKELFMTHITDSVRLDELLGFGVEKTEGELLKRAQRLRPQGDLRSWGSALHRGNQTWVGLALETLQTPYPELLRMCELLELRPGECVVDLGAGYGRLGVVLKLFYPEVDFLGLEYVEERVAQGARTLRELGCERARLYQSDLTHEDFTLPEADCYFIYDYGQVHHIRRTLCQLSTLADRKPFRIVARGEGTRSLIESEHPWLSRQGGHEFEEKFSVYTF